MNSDVRLEQLQRDLARLHSPAKLREGREAGRREAGRGRDAGQIERQAAALSGILPRQTQELLSQQLHGLVEASAGRSALPLSPACCWRCGSRRAA
jgi:hypothetical protein